MKHFSFLFILAIWGLSACTGETDRLKGQVDSLKTELHASEKFVLTLQEVGVLMDSIDATRKVLRLDLKEGTTQQDYTTRMESISAYVRDSQEKINQLESEMEKLERTDKGYLRAIKRLKKDIGEKEQEIEHLTELVDKLDIENKGLITTMDLQEAELFDKNEMIVVKEQELKLIEARIQELMLAGKVSEADAYFERGAAVEEAARRTRLAPAKKKKTYREALELYRKALSLGHEKARGKIAEIEEKLD